MKLPTITLASNLLGFPALQLRACVQEYALNVDILIACMRICQAMRICAFSACKGMCASDANMRIQRVLGHVCKRCGYAHSAQSKLVCVRPCVCVDLCQVGRSPFHRDNIRTHRVV